MVDSNDYNKWFHRALQDIRTIENDLKDDPAFLAEVICYLAQQATEKLLKAYLLFKNQDLPKTHDLLFLNTKCAQFDDGFHKHKDNLEILNLYSIEGRYPGDFFGNISASEAADAYEKVVKIKDMVKNLMKM